jgi:uncharacterized RDD family membrane protein YckC
VTIADERSAWAGFWTRVGAFVLDSTLVGAVAAATGFGAFDLMARLGPAARLIGLALAAGYFGVLGSRIAGGQTLGKRLFKLRVVGLDGNPLPLGRALVRAVLVSLPFIVNGIALKADGGVAAYAVGILAPTTLFGLGLAQVYLLIFNRPSRRLVHDLLLGSMVVRTDATTTAIDAPADAVHRRVALGIVAAFFVLACGLTLYSRQSLPGWLAALQPPLNAVNALPEVMVAGVSDNTSVMVTVQTGRTTTRTLIITAQLNTWPRDQGAEALRVAHTALAHYRLSPGMGIRVLLRYGFDMGIGSGWRTYQTAIPVQPPAK